MSGSGDSGLYEDAICLIAEKKTLLDLVIVITVNDMNIQLY